LIQVIDSSLLLNIIIKYSDTSKIDIIKLANNFYRFFELQQIRCQTVVRYN